MLKTMAISGALVTGIGAAEANVDMWPFIEWDDQNKTVMYPFYANEENGDFKMRWPLYSRSTVIKGEKEIRVSKRFLIFTNERTPRGRTFKLFGIPVRERVSNNNETPQVDTTTQLKS